MEPKQEIVEVFRSGCCFCRGKGRIFYFRPGHEAFPVYRMPLIQQVIINAVRWAAPTDGPVPIYGNTKPIVDFTPAQEFASIQELHEKKA